MFPEDMTEIHQAADSLCATELASRGKGSSCPWGELSRGDVQTDIPGARAPVPAVWHKKDEPVPAPSFRSERWFHREHPRRVHSQSSSSHHSTRPERVCSVGSALDEHAACSPALWAFTPRHQA